MTVSPHSAVLRFGRSRGRVAIGIALLAAAGLTLVGCRPKARQTDPGAHVAIQFDPAPPAVGQTVLNVTLTDAAGQPLRISDLAVEGDMNHAGMKPVFAQLKETSPGHYTGRLDFTMGGDWILMFTGDRAGGGRFEKRIDVPGVSAK